MPERYELGPQRSQGLVDILDRILDKGLVVAGDIRINLANVELLTIKVRLLVCSIDKADEIGLNWWRTDPSLSAMAHHEAVRASQEHTLLAEVNQKLDRLANRLQTLEERRPGIPQPRTGEHDGS